MDAEDIEISHKLKRRNGTKPIIVKFCSHKVKSKLYKACVKLKSVKISDLYPGYASVATKQNRRCSSTKTSHLIEQVWCDERTK